MSLFPDIDKEIEKIREDEEIRKKEIDLKFNEWTKKQKMFEPTCGTHAIMFDGACDGCDNYSYENPKCKIDIDFWMGTPQPEIVEIEDKVICVNHTKIKKENYIKEVKID